jgi:hypothetical protein
MPENCFFPCPPGSIISVVDRNGEEIMHQVIPTKEDLLDKSLIGQSITATDAASKYNVNRYTILTWKKRNLIAVIKDGYKLELDEADVAYCAKIYHERRLSGIRYGAPLLTEDGLPYELKHPKLAQYRHSKKINT